MSLWVRGWLVTSRTRRFRPEWHIGGLHVRLHDTPLAAVGSGFNENTAMYGANWFGYAETAVGGRPTWYQSVVIGISEEGLHGSYRDVCDAMAPPEEGRRERVEPLRATTAFDTVSVHAGDVPANDPLSLMLYPPDLQCFQPDVGVLRRWRYRRRWQRRPAEVQVDTESAEQG